MKAKEIRELFWETHPELSRKKIPDKVNGGMMYNCDARCAFIDFVDGLHRDGQITDNQKFKLAL